MQRQAAQTSARGSVSSIGTPQRPISTHGNGHAGRISAVRVDEVSSLRAIRKVKSYHVLPSKKHEFIPLPDINNPSMPEERRTALFIQKLQQCCIIFDFTSPDEDLPGKEAKAKTLEELIHYIGTHKGVLTERVYPYIFSMISCNLFRTIPPQMVNYIDNFDPEEDEPAMEASWPHLQLVYYFFLCFIESSEFNIHLARHYIDHKFILELLSLFDSEDPREREHLKPILHRIYGKMLTLRAFIRKAINHLFLQFVYESERHNGIAELLEILGSIINGFTLPLKEEHQCFLTQVLLPMHKANALVLYHWQLAYCTIQFIEKDKSLAPKIIMSLLKYWPKVNSMKEIMYLNELEEILMVAGPKEFAVVCKPVFAKLTECIMSLHFQIAERALSFLKNQVIVNLVQSNLHVVVPIILAGIYNNIRPHWNRNIHQQIYTMIKFLINADPLLFDECLETYRKTRAEEITRRKTNAELWERVKQRAFDKKAQNRREDNDSVNGSTVSTSTTALAQPRSSSMADLNDLAIKKVTEELDMLIEHIKNEQPENALTTYSADEIDDSKYSMDPSSFDAMEQAFGNCQFIYDLSQSLSGHINPHLGQDWEARISYEDMAVGQTPVEMVETGADQHSQLVRRDERYGHHSADPSQSPQSLHSQSSTQPQVIN